MPWNLASKTISRVWQFVDQFSAADTIDRADHDVALEDIKTGINDAIAYLITQIDAAASSELYLGVAPSPPTENNAGGALVDGNLYIKSPEYEAYVWNGTAWTLAEQFVPASSYFKGLVSAVDAAALRGLLGLGSAATFDSASFTSSADLVAQVERLTNAIRPVTTVGAGNAFTITSADPITAYADGQGWVLRADRAPTGAATLNVDALGAKDLKKIDASNSLVDIAADDWAAGDLVPVFYDGTRFIVPKYGLLGSVVKTLDTATWEAGTSTTEAIVSPADVKAAIDANEQQVGVGQTYVNYTSSGRVGGTSYQNTTGKPIQVFISARSSVSSERLVQVSPDNSTWQDVAHVSGSAAGAPSQFTFIVPTDYYYRTDGSLNFAGAVSWTELR